MRLGGFPQAMSIYDRLGGSDLEAEDYCVHGPGLEHVGRPDRGPGGIAPRRSALDPDHAESLHLLALAEFQQSRWLEATRAADRLARRPGWEARADLLRGMIRAGDNDPVGAAESIRRALARDPSIRLIPADPSSTQPAAGAHAACRPAGRPRPARS